MIFDEKIRALFENVVRDRNSLHDYQNVAVDFLKKTPFSALFIDLGLGKTCISLTALMDLVTLDEVDCALVIAPLRVANDTWPTEIGLWAHTAGLSWAHIRDDVLTEQVNRAGAAARALIAKHDKDNPEVFKLVKRLRMAKAKSLIKATGRQPSKHPDLVKKAFDRIIEEPVTDEERKQFVSLARAIAAKEAVRDHKQRNPASIYIINRENVTFLVDAWGKDWPYDTVIIDESSALKDHSTKRFKALARVRPLMKRMHQLTATPAAETYLHLFAQIYLLDQGERFGKSFTKFREEYFEYNQYTRKATLREGAEEEIVSKIADICLTMKAEDYLDMQKPHFINQFVHFPPELMEKYRELEETSILELDDGTEIEAETAASVCSKLLQFASGVVYDTQYEFDPDNPDADGVKVKKEHLLHDLKIEKLRQLQEESCGEPLLVSYWFKSSLSRLREAFPDAEIMDKKGAIIKKWNQGKVKMLLVHPASAGHGLNLQYGGRQIVLFDIPWSLELYLQLIGRLHRQGQVNLVIIHHILAKGTLDELVVEALAGKQDAQERLFWLLKKYRSLNKRRPKGIDTQQTL